MTPPTQSNSSPSVAHSRTQPAAAQRTSSRVPRPSAAGRTSLGSPASAPTPTRSTGAASALAPTTPTRTTAAPAAAQNGTPEASFRAKTPTQSWIQDQARLNALDAIDAIDVKNGADTGAGAGAATERAIGFDGVRAERGQAKRIQAGQGVGVEPLATQILPDGTQGEDGGVKSEDDQRAVVWLDIDNTLYKKSTRIAELMGERISAYFLSLGLEKEKARELHKRYYTEYGLAIRGLVKHHDIDPLDYDSKCDASLPLDKILRPDPEIKQLLADLDRTKCRVFALTNAYKHHAHRVLKLLELDQYVEGVIYCDYAAQDFACKPEPEFYTAAMKCIGLSDPSKCYFVDDSALNIRAAKDLGWHSCVHFKEDDPPPVSEEDGQAAATFDLSVLAPTAEGRDFDEAAIQAQFRRLPQHMRIRFLHIVLDACLPGDIATMARTLERHLRSTRDVVSHLPDDVCLRIFERLEVKELLRCRQVSKKWRDIASRPELWRSHTLALTAHDPVPVTPPSEPEGWEPLFKGLWFRERNWAKGLAQRIDFLEGHTNFVTSVRLKGRRTLVTGSYDETIRVWDLATGACRKVLKAKAISCLDFLLEEGVLCAGLYDTGRVMVWDMKTWEVIQILPGHNRGIRNVAISKDHLVSVGQDKAIVVWDWRTGSKIVRFGQQSNVSLGVSIVDGDKIVAVTVDGIIRTFSIRRKEMIGQFNLTKLGGEDAFVTAQLEGLGNSSTMLQWFAAHANTMTLASKDLVVHLEWREHIVPAVDLSMPPSSPVNPLRRSSSTRTGPSPLTQTPVRRVRRDSTQSNASSVSSVRPPSVTPSGLSPSIGRQRRDSTASTTSTASNVTSVSSMRRSLGGAGGAVRSPTMPRANSIKTSDYSSPSAARSPASSRRSSLQTPTSPKPWPLPGAVSPSASAPGLGGLPSANSLHFPSSPSEYSYLASPTHERNGSSSDQARTRIAPNLAAAPRLVSIMRTPDMATGCIDPAKRRIVCASRFSSRAGADRRLYTSTFEMDAPPQAGGGGGPAVSGAVDGGTEEEQENEAKEMVVPIKGAWKARAGELQIPTRNPMAMVLDHEAVVVGCADGTVYRIEFVGAEYDVEPDHEINQDAQEAKDPSVGDSTIGDLRDLRTVWSELMLPPDAPPDHPGRLKKDLLKAVGLR